MQIVFLHTLSKAGTKMSLIIVTKETAFIKE